MKLYTSVYWMMALLYADSCDAYGGNQLRNSKRDDCAAAYCSAQLLSTNDCLAANCPSTNDFVDQQSPVQVIPVPVAVSRRADDTPEVLITFCAVDWPTLTYCSDMACYAATLTSDGDRPRRQLAASDQCVRDRCQRDRDCVRRQCCTSSQLMSRKRRVNDDVSQCIQSYCSGKLFRERILCIVKNCNRSA